jgi:RNA polymerase sigma-70 factor (ECF subfamily)
MAAPPASTTLNSGSTTQAGHTQSVAHVRWVGGRVRHGGPPVTASPAVKARTDATIDRAAIDAQRLDEASRAWLDALHSPSPCREEAIGRLHALLLREARFGVRRRAASLAHPSGADLDDLAVQAADDAVVAILAKLDQFRGESLFTTWAHRFVEREAAATVRRRRGHARELPIDEGFEHARLWAVATESAHERAVARESAQALARLIADVLTARQRQVLIALAIEGVPTDELARRLDTSTGALYKTLHDARRKLRANLTHAPA